MVSKTAVVVINQYNTKNIITTRRGLYRRVCRARPVCDGRYRLLVVKRQTIIAKDSGSNLSRFMKNQTIHKIFKTSIMCNTGFMGA